MKKYNVPRHPRIQTNEREANDILTAKDEYEEVQDFMDEVSFNPLKSIINLLKRK